MLCPSARFYVFRPPCRRKRIIHVPGCCSREGNLLPPPGRSMATRDEPVSREGSSILDIFCRALGSSLLELVDIDLDRYYGTPSLTNRSNVEFSHKSHPRKIKAGWNYYVEISRRVFLCIVTSRVFLVFHKILRSWFGDQRSE